MGLRLGHWCSEHQQCWRRGLGVNATGRRQGRGGVGTRHAGMEQVSKCKTKRNKKNELTKWHTQTHAVAGVDEPGRGEGEVDTASSWLRHRWRVGVRHGGMSRCQVWATLGKQEWAEGDNRMKKKNYSLIMETIPGQCHGRWHSTEARCRWSQKRLGEWGWRGMWQVRGSLENENVSKGKQQKKNTYAAGAWTMGPKGQDNTAEYLEKTLARRKKQRR